MSADEAGTVAAFMHDVPMDLAREALRRERGESETPWEKPWPLDRWPDVPTRFLLCRDDRFFPPHWMRRVVRERLGIEQDEIDGSHCVALSRPQDLAQRLAAYIDEA
jgi:pimeloyl-ACP methyl ester carboxylesterase